MTILCYAGDNVPAQTPPAGFKNYRSGSTTIDTIGFTLRADPLSTKPNFGFAGNRMFYQTDMLSASIMTYAGCTFDNEFAHDRLPIATAQTGNVTWAQVGAALPGSSTYNALVTRGQELAQWQSDHRGLGKWGASFAFCLAHEVNANPRVTANGGNIAAAGVNWLAGMRNVVEIWKAQGVTMWVGTNNFTTTVEGCMPGVNVIAGNPAFVGHENDIDNFWPVNSAAANYQWANDNLIVASWDIYNGSTLLRYWPVATLSNPSRLNGQSRAAAAAARGRPFLQFVHEQACAEIQHFTSGAGVGSGAYVGQGWAATYPGVTYSKALWLQQAASYYNTSWPDLAALVYWDDNAGPSPENVIDSSQAAWDSFVVNWVNNPSFKNVSDPIGAVSTTMKTLVVN